MNINFLFILSAKYRKATQASLYRPTISFQQRIKEEFRKNALITNKKVIC